MTVNLVNPAKAKNKPEKIELNLLLFRDNIIEIVKNKKETICEKFQDVPTILTQKWTVPKAKNMDNIIAFFVAVIFLSKIKIKAILIDPNTIDTNCSVVFGIKKTNGISAKAAPGGKGKYLWLLNTFTS